MNALPLRHRTPGWLVVAAVAGIAACASTDSLLGEPDASPEPSAIPDPAADGGRDAEPTDLDAGPCTDCEYFPEVCTPDALCAGGPFDPSTPGGSLDMRARIMTIRGRSSSDVWAAGALGALAHFDGTTWRRSDPGPRETMRALWLRDSEEIAVALPTSLYARGLDGGAAPSADGWTVRKLPVPFEFFGYIAVEFESAWAAPGSDSLWCAMRVGMSGLTSGLWRLRRSPTSEFELGPGVPADVCTALPCDAIMSIHGASANELWAVGQRGAALRITNAESETPSVKAFNSRTWNALNGVWAASASEAWAVGTSGTIRHYTGHPVDWEVVSDVPTTEPLNAVWGSSSSDVWAVGDAGVVLHYDGKTWSRVKVAGLGARRPDLTTVWASAPGHVWIGGHGVILSLGGKP